MSSEVAKVFVVFYLLAFHTEDFIIDFSVSLMFFLLLLWLLIFPSSMHHKDIHSILAHVHNILLHTAGRDQPWGQRWLLLQALLISFFFIESTTSKVSTASSSIESPETVTGISLWISCCCCLGFS